MPGDQQTGHQEGLALGFLMKKYEGACRVGTGVGDGVKEGVPEGLALSLT